MIKRIKKATVHVDLGSQSGVSEYNLAAIIENGDLDTVIVLWNGQSWADFSSALRKILNSDLSRFLEFIKEVQIAIEETGSK